MLQPTAPPAPEKAHELPETSDSAAAAPESDALPLPPHDEIARALAFIEEVGRETYASLHRMGVPVPAPAPAGWPSVSTLAPHEVLKAYEETSARVRSVEGEYVRTRRAKEAMAEMVCAVQLDVAVEGDAEMRDSLNAWSGDYSRLLGHLLVAAHIAERDLNTAKDDLDAATTLVVDYFGLNYDEACVVRPNDGEVCVVRLNDGDEVSIFRLGEESAGTTEKGLSGSEIGQSPSPLVASAEGGQ